MKYDATSNCVAEVSEEVCALFAKGERGTFEFNGVPYELTDVAYCSEFVRECNESAYGRGPHVLPFFGGTARETESILKSKGKQVYTPQRGDIVCFNKNTGQWGHIGIFLGDGKFAENTSSTDRGPGFVISPISKMQSRITGFYRILPARPAPEIETEEIKVINIVDGSIIQKLQMVENGNHIPDQKKLYVKVK